MDRTLEAFDADVARALDAGDLDAIAELLLEADQRAAEFEARNDEGLS